MKIGNAARRHGWKLALLLYIVLIVVFCILKFNGLSFVAFEQSEAIIRSKATGDTPSNLVPFRTIFSYLRALPNHYAMVNLLGNILMCVPLPILLERGLSVRLYRWRFAIALMFIVGIEAFQEMTNLGFFDVDDILLGVIGMALGFFISGLVRRLAM